MSTKRNLTVEEHNKRSRRRQKILLSGTSTLRFLGNDRYLREGIINRLESAGFIFLAQLAISSETYVRNRTGLAENQMVALKNSLARKKLAFDTRLAPFYFRALEKAIDWTEKKRTQHEQRLDSIYQRRAEAPRLRHKAAAIFGSIRRRHFGS